jgi:hypothetical protein
MPIHAHDRAERLKPERMRKPLKKFVTAIVMHDGLRDDRAERCHARCEPRWDATAMERKIGAACSSCHAVPKKMSRPPV